MNELDNICGHEGLNELALFAGAGGGILGGKILGWHTVCAVEIDEYARNVLVARQNDGTFPPFPIWDDVRNFDGRPWRGIIDVVSGGFPCQDISIAGKGKGLDGERSGLWSEMARIIGEVRPRYVFVENSPMLIRRGLDRVLGDLAEMGHDAVWGVVGADDAGAHHRRKRLWILAHSRYGSWRNYLIKECGSVSQGEEKEEWCNYTNKAGGSGKTSEIVADTNRNRTQGMEPESQPRGLGRPTGLHRRAGGTQERKEWPPEPGVGRVVDGLPHRAHRIKALGNGQVPRVVAMAWRVLNTLKDS